MCLAMLGMGLSFSIAGALQPYIERVMGLILLVGVMLTVVDHFAPGADGGTGLNSIEVRE